MSARLLVEEMLKLAGETRAPHPVRLHINPRMWRALREHVQTYGTLVAGELEVHHNQHIHTYAVEYSDGTFRVPELEGS